MSLRLTRKTGLLVGAAGLLVLTGASAIATDDDTSDKPITGSSLQKARDAALAEVGGGRVTETEAEGEDGKSVYEVEVTRRDGSQVEVELDRRFEVVASESEDEADEKADDEADDAGEKADDQAHDEEDDS